MLRTPLFDFHRRAGARMVQFAGWEMPILYRGIAEEHRQTRTRGGMFDVSHMGRLRVDAGSTAALNGLLTRDISRQQLGQSRYSLVCNDAGGTLDDIIVSRMSDGWLIVCNASNRAKIVNHLSQHMSVDDQTVSTIMLALQGPAVLSAFSQRSGHDAGALRRYGLARMDQPGLPMTVFRSGYTGEDGVELIAPADALDALLEFLKPMLEGDNAVLVPVGLGARDTLRLEAGMPLYGHELDESIDPVSAQLAWAVDLEHDFVGAEALRQISRRGPERRLVGLRLQSQRIARGGMTVLHESTQVGVVTSGTLSPTLGASIAMALVEAPSAGVGTPLQIDLRSATVDAEVVALPFYKRAR